jgi:hypothetical protein
LQLVDDVSQIRNQVVEAIGIVELPTNLNLPGAGGSHVIDNATLIGTERARVDELLLIQLEPEFGICRGPIREK